MAVSRLITRAEWGAKHADGFGSTPMPYEAFVLHHTATVAPDAVAPFDDDDAAVRRIEDIGQKRFGGGMSYPFLFTPVGLRFQGLSPDRRGAHTKGFNTSHRALCAIGNYSDTHLTDAQVEAMAQTMVDELLAGRAKRAEIVGGHRDMKGAATECPGSMAHTQIPAINARAAELLESARNGELASTAGSAVDPGTLGPLDPLQLPVLRLRSEGPRVMDLQRLLGVEVDGDFGRRTERAVEAFQRRHNLDVDGVVGPKTWRSLLGQ